MDRRTATQVVAAQRSYDRLTAQARTRTLTQLRQAWLSLGAYRDADIEKWLNRVVPLVMAGEWTIAQLTAAYLARVVGLANGERITAEPVKRADVTGERLRGVDPTEVYRRPAVTLYSSLAAGLSFRESVNRGLTRALDIAQIDMQLARTHTVAGSTRISSYRRTLSGLENCELCSIASTHRYYRGDLMPIHGRCDCGIMPVFATDPHTEPLDGIEVRQHGELGPVLTVTGQHFTGPDDL
jgi:hypothetical protein